MREIVPVSQLGTRIPEQGRIRLGVKTRTAMKSIDTFRFTSPDAKAIAQIAELYGGDVERWSDPKANPRDQWQVITKANDIRIFLPVDALSTHYELWSGGGVTRRCDGETAEIPQSSGPDAGEMVQVPCLCVKAHKLACKPYSRLRVILPEVRFGGVWRLETKGWHAARELPAMQAMIEQLQTIGIMEARLSLTRRMSEGGRRQFVVPQLQVDATPLQIVQGAAKVEALSAGHGPAALGTGSSGGSPGPTTPPEFRHTDETPPDEGMVVEPRDWFEDDDEVIDAEIVELTEDAGAEAGRGTQVAATDSPSTRQGAAEPAPVTPGTSPGFATPGAGSAAPSRVDDAASPIDLEPPAGPVTERARRRSADPTQTKLVLLCADVAGRAGVDETELRHAIAFSLSGGTTESSKELTVQQKSMAIDILGSLAEDRVRIGAVEETIAKYRRRPM